MKTEPIKHWMAIYTKPKNERKVFDKLQKLGFEVYLPLHKVVRQWSDRKKKILVPLISSYVFVKTDEANRLAVLKTIGVLNFVFWLGKPAIIQDIEIERIKYFLKESINHEIIIENMAVGDVAMVSSGHFKGQKVEIVDTDNKEYFVNLISLGMRLRLSKLDVQKITNANI